MTTAETTPETREQMLARHDAALKHIDTVYEIKALVDEVQSTGIKFGVWGTDETRAAMRQAKETLDTKLWEVTAPDHIVDANKMVPVDEVTASIALRSLYNETVDYATINNLGGKDSTHALRLAAKVLDGRYSPSLADFLYHAVETIKARHELPCGEEKDLLKQLQGYFPDVPSAGAEPVGYGNYYKYGQWSSLLHQSAEEANKFTHETMTEIAVPLYRHPASTAEESTKVAPAPVTVAPCGVVDKIKSSAIRLATAFERLCRPEHDAVTSRYDERMMELNAALAKLVTLPEPNNWARPYCKDDPERAVAFQYYGRGCEYVVSRDQAFTFAAALLAAAADQEGTDAKS